MELDELLTTAQVAAKTGRRTNTVWKIARRHGLGRKIGRDWLFTSAEAEAIAAIDRRGGKPRRDGSPIVYRKAADQVAKGRKPRQVSPEGQGAG